MPVKTNYEIEGLDELKVALKALPKAYETRLIRDAHKEALKPLKRKVASKGRSMRLRRAGSWSIRNDRKRINKNPTAAIMAPTTNLYFLRFLERGTNSRVLKRGIKNPQPFRHHWTTGNKQTTYTMGAWKGARRGKIRAQPYVEKTYVAGAKSIVANVSEVYADTMETVLKRHGVRIRKRINKL